MFQKKRVWFRDVQTLTEQPSRNVCLSCALECVMLWLLSPSWYASPTIDLFVKALDWNPGDWASFQLCHRCPVWPVTSCLVSLCATLETGGWCLPIPKGRLSIHINQSCAQLLMDNGRGGESEHLSFTSHGITPWEILVVLSVQPS